MLPIPPPPITLPAVTPQPMPPLHHDVPGTAAAKPEATPVAPHQPRLRDRMSVGEPAKPLRLPLARWIPQDVHSLIDTLSGLALAICSLTDDRRASTASTALGVSALGMSVISDERTSVASVIPIEVHEMLDLLWAVSAIAAPFVLGYRRTARRIAVVHVAAGVWSLVDALFTDYRAYARRSQAAAR